MEHQNVILSLVSFSREFVQNNSFKLPPDLVDALIVDFINYYSELFFSKSFNFRLDNIHQTDDKVVSEGFIISDTSYTFVELKTIVDKYLSLDTLGDRISRLLAENDRSLTQVFYVSDLSGVLNSFLAQYVDNQKKRMIRIYSIFFSDVKYKEVSSQKIFGKIRDFISKCVVAPDPPFIILSDQAYYRVRKEGLQHGNFNSMRGYDTFENIATGYERAHSSEVKREYFVFLEEVNGYHSLQAYIALKANKLTDERYHTGNLSKGFLFNVLRGTSITRQEILSAFSFEPSRNSSNILYIN